VHARILRKNELSLAAQNVSFHHSRFIAEIRELRTEN